jgi:hypothetical protein
MGSAGFRAVQFGKLRPSPPALELSPGHLRTIAVLRICRLSELAVKTADGDIVRRLLGIALLLDGWSRGEAATASGMDRQTLCDWVHRYNSGDVAGLASAPRCGRPSALSEAQIEPSSLATLRLWNVTENWSAIFARRSTQRQRTTQVASHQTTDPPTQCTGV